MRWLMGLLIVLSGVVPAAGDTILIVNKHGAWSIDTATDPPRLTRLTFDRILIDGQSDDGDDNDTGDVDADLVSELAELSRDTLKSDSEAHALLALLGTLIDLVDEGELKPADLKRAIDASLPVLAIELKSGNRLTQWFQQVSRLVEFDVEGVNTLRHGVAAAFDLDLSAFGKTVDMATWLVSQGRSREAAAAVTGESAIDLVMILKLIQAILELLTQLGIIGG